jgi:hypothetical protein
LGKIDMDFSIQKVSNWFARPRVTEIGTGKLAAAGNPTTAKFATNPFGTCFNEGELVPKVSSDLAETPLGNKLDCFV